MYDSKLLGISLTFITIALLTSIIRLNRMFVYVQFISLIICLLVKAGSSVEDELVLELVHVFFRHGSRTPDKFETYPTDPLAVDAFQPFGYGHLTNVGKQRAYQLGKVLRQRYASFLGEIYSPEMVACKSTDYVRTQMSALLVLAGLFPPCDLQKWDIELNWLPIPCKYEQLDRDYELRRSQLYCPVSNKELYKTLESESAQNFLTNHQQDFNYISNHSGRNVKTLFDAFFLYQALYAEERMNLTLPEWTKLVYPSTLHNLSVHLINFGNLSPLSKRLSGGRMLKKIIDNMIAKSNGVLKPTGQKIVLYSGHEVNVASILGVLNLFDMKFPDFSSAVLIELYKSIISKQHSVKVVYVRDVYRQPEELVIPGCTTFCPLVQLVESVTQYMPDNYTDECGSSILLD